VAAGNPVLQRQSSEIVLVERTEPIRSAAEKAVKAWSASQHHRKLVTAEDWREWQANTFSSAVTMPEWAVQEMFWSRTGAAACVASGNENEKELALDVADELLFSGVIYEKSLAQAFGVSRQAMAIRLLELNLVTKEQ
jgi:Zn-dependent peptidase ImmA (M78 family)